MLSTSEQLLYTTVRIESDYGNGKGCTGTGFFFKFKEKEFEVKLNETIDKQVCAVSDETLDGEAEVNEMVADGPVTIEDIKSRLLGKDGGDAVCGQGLQGSFGHYELNEDSEAEICAKLASDLRNRIAELQQERNGIEAQQGILIYYKKDFDFFMKCLLELPETNLTGMKIMVDGLDTDGSTFWDVNGKAKAGWRSSVNSGYFKITLEQLAETPDFLNFERGIYSAFITDGILFGNIIEYHTNFGVPIPSVGNNRLLGCFLEFKRCRDDGKEELLNVTYKVHGGRVRYQRRSKKGCKGKNGLQTEAIIAEVDGTIKE